MTSSIFRLGAFVFLVLGACTFEPEPTEVYSEGIATESITLRGERMPAEEIYWTFFSHPQAALPSFDSLTRDTVQFTPRVPGVYVVDRWIVSGPAGVWTDRFIVDVKN